MLASTVATGRLPTYYIQSVSSGAGAIAAWEASLRLIEDGRFGDRLPKLYLVQNDPFIPMVNAWRAKRRQIIPELDMPNAEESIDRIFAPELSSQEPVYSSAGGVYDALLETGGGMYAVTNNEIAEAKRLFEEVEGIDILPAAAASLATLIRIFKENKMIDLGNILINITGGGVKRLREDREVYPIKPWLTIKGESDMDNVVKEIKSEFSEVAEYGPTGI
jgi:cysteate synthase